MSILQYALVLISLFFIADRVIRFVRKERAQTAYKLLTTLFIWGGILFTSLFPITVHDLSRKMGFGENLNTLIFFGFVVVFFVLFKLLGSVESAERQITEIVRKEALDELRKKSTID